MHMLASFKAFILDLLFPQKPKVLSLEALSPDKLLSVLPESGYSKEKETVALFYYGHPLVKEIVWEVKYNGNRNLADKLGEVLYDTIVATLEEKNVFEKYKTVLLLPMPISDKRRYERGWNQAELLTSAIKARDCASRFKHLPRQLVKVHHTESQTRTASRDERRKNLKDSMKVQNPLSVKGRYVVLVDDVTTTGSTFAEAKRALNEAGAKKILCVAVAH